MTRRDTEKNQDFLLRVSLCSVSVSLRAILPEFVFLPYLRLGAAHGVQRVGDGPVFRRVGEDAEPAAADRERHRAQAEPVGWVPAAPLARIALPSSERPKPMMASPNGAFHSQLV